MTMMGVGVKPRFEHTVATELHLEKLFSARCPEILSSTTLEIILGPTNAASSDRHSLVLQ